MTRHLFALLLMLVLSALACALPLQATETPPTRVPPSTQDVEELKEEVATASARFAESGELSITVTEQQLTAFLLEGLASQPDITMTEPQVILQNGQIQLSGKMMFGKVNVPVQIVLAASVQNGALVVGVVSANFGIIPIPEKLLTQITDMINKNLTQSITMEGRQLDVEQVEIADGTMKITGKGR